MVQADNEENNMPGPSNVVPVWYLSVSLLFMLINVGLHGTVYVLILPCALYLLSELRSCTIIWGTVLAAIFILNVEHIMISFDLAEGPHYMLFLCQAWTIIRSLNFSLDRIAAPVSIPNLSELITMLAYCFYFPTLILGPLLTYQNFKTGVVAEMGSWSLYGLGYCMGQFFMLKYVVMYGLMGTIARAENINAPQHPKCIARISLYSDMWRYFDEGLYRFLLRWDTFLKFGRFQQHDFTVSLYTQYSIGVDLG
uniref:Uncharacterized protein n=1 Tax=Timema tahoe TaxID=61484 RepID=A0A7R9IM80_9NEOP|nr:unnamed protein product [Timema tahoe]